MAVVFLALLLNEILGLSHVVKEIAIQTFPLQRADKALDEGVLPGMAGFAVEGLAAAGMQPSLDLIGDELRAIVAAQMLRDAACGKQPLEHIQHASRRD